MTIECLVINRAQDTGRLQRFNAKAEAFGWTVRRLPAFDAHRAGFPFFAFADLIGPHFWGGDDVKPGAIGCFLSHRRAWEEVVRGDAPMVLICEDDMSFRETPERLTVAAVALGEFDILFANDRLAAWAGDAGAVVPLPEAVRRIAASGAPPSRAPGADCYLLTRRGAERLLEITARDRIVCGVDWALVMSGADTAVLSSDEIAGWSELAILTERMGAAPPQVVAHILAEPVGEQKGGGPSVLEHGVTLPMASLTDALTERVEVREIVTLGRGPATYSFALSAPEDPVQGEIAIGRIPEVAAVSALIRIFPQGGTFIDAGAGPGVWSVMIGRAGGAGRVLPVEPDPESARLVAANMAMNGLSAVLDASGLGLGLGASPGWARLAGPAKRPSQRRLRAMEEDSTDTPVTVTTGAALAGDLDVDAVKIDVGGSEHEVLRGFGKLLRRQRPVLVIEMAVQQMERLGEVLERFGYSAFEEFPAADEGRVIRLLR